MVNREIEMDHFLKYFAQIYQQNPDYQVSSNTLYSYLTVYGLSEVEQKNNDIKDLFEKWQNKFQRNPYLDVFHSMKQHRFLQFRSRGDVGQHHVKLYLSFPKEHMESCVNTLFNYIAVNGMENLSKVADVVRSDSVVLRMHKMEDALKVIDYVNNTPALSMYAKPTNPFVMRAGKVGVAYDDMISYNSTLAALMEQYFIYCRNSNKLKSVSKRDFMKYVKLFSKVVFRDSDQLQKFLNLSRVSESASRFGNVGEEVVNYEHVIQLIFMSLDGKMTMRQFQKFHKEASDNIKNSQMASYYNQFLQNDYSNRFSQKQAQKAQVNAKEILDQYIDFAIKKYGEQNVYLYIREYLSGHNNSITRDGNFREKFVAYLPPEKLFELTNHNAEKYVQDYIQSKRSGTVLINDDNLYDLVIQTCKATYEKYGYRQLEKAIATGLSGVYSYFTNGDRNYRNQLQNCVTAQQFSQYCERMVREYGSNMTLVGNIGACCAKIVEEMVLKQTLVKSETSIKR